MCYLCSCIFIRYNVYQYVCATTNHVLCVEEDREFFVRSGKSSESNFDPTPNEAEVIIKGAREAHFCVIQSEITGEVCTNEPDWRSKSS